MKVKSSENIQVKPMEKKKSSKAEVEAKLAAKFGKKILKKKKTKNPEDTTQISAKGVKNSKEEGFGDIGLNDPKSKLTQEKLKNILKTGAFEFSDKEKAALGKILK